MRIASIAFQTAQFIVGVRSSKRDRVDSGYGRNGATNWASLRVLRAEAGNTNFLRYLRHSPMTYKDWTLALAPAFLICHRSLR